MAERSLWNDVFDSGLESGRELKESEIAIFDDLDIHICEHEWVALEDRGREAENA